MKILKKYVPFILTTVGYIVLTTLIKTGNITNLLKNLLVPLTCYIVVTIALNLVVGISGELSLGHAGFMSIGAFSAVITSGLLANYISSDFIRLIIAIIVGTIIAAIMGLLISIPVLKLEGDYLAIVTLAFGQIIKGLLNNIYFGFDANGIHFSFVENKLSQINGVKVILAGPQGAVGTERLSNFTCGYVLILITLFVVCNLIDSKKGREIIAVRDDKIASASVGVDVVKTKMLAFVISAALAGAAGALYGLNYTTLTPAKFDYNQSIMILVYVVFGGLGNITGSIISTIILFILPELLRSLQDYRMLIYSIVLILMMLFTNNKTIQSFFDKLFSRRIKHEKE